jgi:hypothetical protein
LRLDIGRESTTSLSHKIHSEKTKKGEKTNVSKRGEIGERSKKQAPVVVIKEKKEESKEG